MQGPSLCARLTSPGLLIHSGKWRFERKLLYIPDTMRKKSALHPTVCNYINVLSLIIDCDSGNTENQTSIDLLHENLQQINITYFFVRKISQCSPRLVFCGFQNLTCNIIHRPRPTPTQEKHIIASSGNRANDHKVQEEEDIHDLDFTASVTGD